MLRRASVLAWLLYIWRAFARHRDVKCGAGSVSVEGKRQKREVEREVRHGRHTDASRRKEEGSRARRVKARTHRHFRTTRCCYFSRLYIVPAIVLELMIC
jgi:hypothetical protein